MGNSSEQLNALQEEMNTFLTRLSCRQELNGISIQMAVHKPPYSSNHVATIHIGTSPGDTEASVNDLLRRVTLPTHRDDRFGGYNPENSEEIAKLFTQFRRDE